MQKTPVNRCLNGNCPKKTKEEKVKELLLDANQKKRARKTLTTLRQERRCRYAGLLKLAETWVATGRMSLYVFEELIRIVERQRNRKELSNDEILDLEAAKISPVRDSQ